MRGLRLVGLIFYIKLEFCKNYMKKIISFYIKKIVEAKNYRHFHTGFFNPYQVIQKKNTLLKSHHFAYIIHFISSSKKCFILSHHCPQYSLSILLIAHSQKNLLISYTQPSIKILTLAFLNEIHQIKFLTRPLSIS